MAADILQKIAASARERVERDRRRAPLQAVRRAAEQVARTPFRFEAALRGKSPALICEIKKASPSKGVIAPDFEPLEIARAYAAAGADAISVLTEPEFFLGGDAILQSVAQTVDTPLLRKDFVVDEYMLYAARALGADAALLICALLTPQALKSAVQLCDALGLSALVETRTREEIETALKAGARIVGVNNRDLTDFSVDPTRARTLREAVPKDVLFVAESGVRTRADVLCAGADAVLVGEALMRADDKAAALRELRGGV